MANDLVYYADLFGVAVFAVTGALAAGRGQMDVFGVIVVSCATALGGGTLRDVALGRAPLFWITDTSYLLVVLAAGLATVLCIRFVRPPANMLVLADAVGLATFAVIGCRVALRSGAGPLVSLLMGVVTGVFGGIVRDLLCGSVPLVLRREIYATAALSGGAVFIAMRACGVVEGWSMLVGAAVVLAARLAGIRYGLMLPVLDLDRLEGERSGKTQDSAVGPGLLGDEKDMN